MRILYITSMYPVRSNENGGIFIPQRVKALRQIGAELQVITIIQQDTVLYRLIKNIFRKSNDKYDFLYGKKSKYIQDGVEFNVVYFKIGIISKLCGEKWIIRKAAEKILRNCDSFDCIHAHWLHKTGSIARILSKLSNKPYFVTCHGSDINYLLKNKSVLKYALQTLKDAKKVEFVSQKLFETAKRYGYDGSNMSIIPNGIWVSDFKKKKHDSQNNSVKKIGYVGNLIYVKRADKFNIIINSIIDKYAGEVEFHIVGSGEYENILRDELKDLNVKFYGNIPHIKISEFMNGIDVLILPSRNEGWPCVVLEANICGTPVIGSDCGGIPEAIDNSDLVVADGVNFEQRFSEKVVQLLNGEIDIDINEMVNRAKKFDWITLQKKSYENYCESENKCV